MKKSFHQRPKPSGFTLVELSLVIFVLIALMTSGIFFSSAVSKWKAGREASETLRSVYVAQRTYLADHPTQPIDTLTEAELLPYIPNKPSSFPKVEGLDDVMRSIDVTVSPPVVTDGGGAIYDPSGKPDDSLWDVGE
jgi:type II secretory pathway pseudopilin PulG